MTEPEPATCGHGHVKFLIERGRADWAHCAACGADVTARERRADHWRGIFDRSHPYEVVGPHGVVAQFSESEWNGDRTCRCGEIAVACAVCQASDLAAHSDLTLSAWHLAGHPDDAGA